METFGLVSVGFFSRRVEVSDLVSAMRHGGLPRASHWTGLGHSLVSRLGSLPLKWTSRNWTVCPNGKKTNSSREHKA